MTHSTGPVILFVEDDELIAELAVLALEEAGFRVALFHSGPDALAALNGGGAEFAAMITDIELGQKPDGWSLARQAREMFPDLPVVYVSGGHFDKWASKGVPGSKMIGKPYAVGQLVVAVSTVMLDADNPLGGGP